MAASEKKLGGLHEHVANELDEQVVGYMEPVFDLEGKVVSERKVRPSPAVLSAAIAFLKNNNITADVEDNAAMRQLSEALAARRKKKIPQAQLDAAAEAFADRFGGPPLQ